VPIGTHGAHARAVRASRDACRACTNGRGRAQGHGMSERETSGPGAGAGGRRAGVRACVRRVDGRRRDGVGGTCREHDVSACS
jgi:hypothetical protein